MYVYTKTCFIIGTVENDFVCYLCGPTLYAFERNYIMPIIFANTKHKMNQVILINHNSSVFVHKTHNSRKKKLLKLNTEKINVI